MGSGGTARVAPPQRPTEARGPSHRGAPSPARLVPIAVAVGALGAGVVELVAQVLLHFRDMELAGTDLPVPWLQIAILPLVAACVVGAAAGLVALPASLLARGRALPIAIVVTALGIALALCFHVVGLGARYTSGLYPGASAATLLVESPAQFVHQATESYPQGIPMLAVGVAAAWACAAAALVAAHRRVGSWSRARCVIVPVLAFAGAALLAWPSVPLALRVHSLETTELALYTSVLDERTEDATPSATERARTLDGPPRGEAEAYRERLGAMGRSDRPNVLLIMLESVPADATGFGGYRTRPVTPNLDRLAAASARYRRVWTTSTHSNYAQMAILSSLFPRRGGRLDTYRNLEYPRVLPQDLLRPLGYDTATFSSQDENWQGMRRFQTTPTPHHFFASHSFDGPKMSTRSNAKIPDDTTVGAAIEWLRRPRRSPFYMYVNLQQTHFPYRLPPGEPRRFAGPTLQELQQRGLEVAYMRIAPAARDDVRVAFDDALRFVDAQVGRLLDALRASGELDDTLVIVTSDHGESFGQYGVVTHGKTLREPEARTPLLVSLPGRVAPRDVDVPVSHLDVMPTVLDLLGLPPYPGYQGTSLLRREAAARERTGIFLTMQGLRHADGVVCHPWKFVHDRSKRRTALYHLGRDPGERQNLVNVRAPVARALEATLDAQIAAQLGYHRRSRTGDEDRLAPRLARCPDLPAR